MAHIILTGATGTAGSAVLAHALQSPAISRVSILSRRPVKLAEHPKAQVLIHTDYEMYDDALLKQLSGATACIWAQGISSRGMQEAEYKKITVDYPLAAARAFATMGGQKMNFVFVSGEGADMDGGGMVMYGRVKGQAERRLLELQKETPTLKVFNVRPATILPKGGYTAEREPSFQDRLVVGVGSIFEKVWKSMVIPTNCLAHVLVDLAVGDGEPVAAGVGVEADGRLLRNTALRRLAGL